MCVCVHEVREVLMANEIRVFECARACVRACVCKIKLRATPNQAVIFYWVVGCLYLNSYINFITRPM